MSTAPENTFYCLKRNDKSSFNEDYLENCNRVRVQEQLTVSKFSTNIPDVNLNLIDNQIDRYSFPVNLCANRMSSSAVENQGSMTNKTDAHYMTFSRKCYKLNSVDNVDFSLPRTFQNSDFNVPRGIPDTSISSFSNKSLDSGIYNLSSESPDIGIFSLSSESPDTDMYSLSNDSPDSDINSLSNESTDGDIYRLPQICPNYDAFGAPNSYVDTDAFILPRRSQDFTSPKTDSVNGFVLPKTPNTLDVLNCNNREVDSGNLPESSCSSSFWNNIPESCDLFPTHIYPSYYLQVLEDYSLARSDTSSVYSMNSTDSPPKKRSSSFRYVQSPPYKSYEHESSGTLPNQVKGTCYGKSISNDDSPKNDSGNFRLLQTTDSEARYQEARRTSLEENRKESFPVCKDTPVTIRASSSDQDCGCPTSEPAGYKSEFTPNSKPSTLVTHKSGVGFIDSHCHLDFLFQKESHKGTFADYRNSHQDSFPENYEGCVAVFCNPHTFPKKFMWGKYLEEDGIWAAFGCHPNNAHIYNECFEEHLRRALSHPKVVALGEIGLDYSNRFENAPKERQQEVFRRQLKIAKDRSLPLVIHCRDANEDCMRIMKEMIPEDYRIHLHCFSDAWCWAKKWLDAFPNLFLGITNLVNFSSAKCVHHAVRKIPLNRLLLETDAPYFIPRSISDELQWSHPGLAIHVAAKIAALRDISLDEILTSVRRNTERMYRI